MPSNVEPNAGASTHTHTHTHTCRREQRFHEEDSRHAAMRRILGVEIRRKLHEQTRTHTHTHTHTFSPTQCHADLFFGENNSQCAV